MSLSGFAAFRDHPDRHRSGQAECPHFQRAGVSRPGWGGCRTAEGLYHLGKPLLAARLQPQERAGAHQFPHRPGVRHGEPLRPRPGKDGTSLQLGRRGDDGDGAWTRPGRTSGDDALPCQGILPEGSLRPEPDSPETVPDPTPGDAARVEFWPWPSIMPELTVQGAKSPGARRNPAEEGGRGSRWRPFRCMARCRRPRKSAAAQMPLVTIRNGFGTQLEIHFRRDYVLSWVCRRGVEPRS